MKSLAETVPQVLLQAKPKGLMPLPDAQPKAVVLHQDHQAKQQMAAMLTQLFLTLKTYGKEPEQLEALIPLFNLTLADYTFERIEKAFAFYLKTSNEMPTPADIANIIERGTKPPFDRSVYIAISKKHPEDRNTGEWEYMQDYERFIISGKF